jgi:cytoskeleton protein RodZ
MPEIGATLREARMRERIDISEIEAQTKIRAKYLRALENEEWDLLPGSTYVKTFLREYANALGLDGRLLVEEYKLNHERPSELELQPISPSRPRDRDRRRRGRPSLPRGTTAIFVVVGLLIVVAILGLIGGSSSNNKPKHAATNRIVPPAGQSSSNGAAASTGATAAPAPTGVSLQLLATGTVYVCMTGTTGKKILNGVTLSAGQRTHVFMGKRFLVTVGNSQVKMRVNGKIRNVPSSNNPINYVITPAGRHTLAAAQAPSCT